MGFDYLDKTFYFVRHGVTEANQKKLWCGGDWDVELHLDGHAQANSLADKMFEMRSNIDRIYSSPMLRAQQTAQALNAKAQIPIEIVEDLREWRIGKLERSPFTTPLLGKAVSDWADPVGGETLQEFRSRIIKSVSYCLENSERPLIVSHGAFCRVLIDLLRIPERHIANCALFKISSSKSDKQLRWQLTDH